MRSVWKAVALLIVTFAGGVFTGRALATRQAAVESSGFPRGHDTEAFVRFLSDSLGLATTESDSVRAVLERNRPSMDSLWQAMAPRFDTLRASIRAQIRSHLTPEQQTKYVDLMARYDAWRQRNR